MSEGKTGKGGGSDVELPAPIDGAWADSSGTVTKSLRGGATADTNSQIVTLFLIKVLFLSLHCRKVVLFSFRGVKTGER